MTQVNDYFELKIEINPQMSEILSELISDICFENLHCEGIVFAEEVYKDDLVLVSTTEGTLKVYLKSNSKLQSRLGFLTQQQKANTELNSIREDIGNILKEQRETLLESGFHESELGSWDFEISEVKNEDWSKKWKENWEVTHVSDRIAVVPSWLEYAPKSGEITIALDPGSAFGTGTHPTTQLCMRALEKYMKKGDTIADIGMGSGILGICALKFGAKSVYGCDNDELVIETAIENAKMNNVDEKCFFEHNTADKITTDHVALNLFQGRIDEGEHNCEQPCDAESSSARRNDSKLHQFDFITANILHNVLAEIMDDLKKLMKDNAIMSLSGILDEKKPVVIEAIKKHNLQLIEESHQDIWVGLVVKKVLK